MHITSSPFDALTESLDRIFKSSYARWDVRFKPTIKSDDVRFVSYDTRESEKIFYSIKLFNLFFSTNNYIVKSWNHIKALTWNKSNFASSFILFQLVIIQNFIVRKHMLPDVLIHHRFEKVWIRNKINHF